jgi:hypothetical protein
MIFFPTRIFYKNLPFLCEHVHWLSVHNVQGTGQKSKTFQGTALFTYRETTRQPNKPYYTFCELDLVFVALYNFEGDISHLLYVYNYSDHYQVKL